MCESHSKGKLNSHWRGMAGGNGIGEGVRRVLMMVIRCGDGVTRGLGVRMEIGRGYLW